MTRLLKMIFFGAVGIFALIGIAFTFVFIAMHFGWLNVRGSIADRNSFFGILESHAPCDAVGETLCAWNRTPEWDTVAGGLMKDTVVIAKVSGETGIPARLIASVVVPEQLRFFTSEREVFKSYFEPLKILGSLSQFSLGVSGIKEETAQEIEKNAGDTSSPFYPGPDLNGLLAYKTDEATSSDPLYDRLTDPKDHHYSYLYTALYIKEVEAQWASAGHDIRNDPAIVATLFNIGFANSHPNGVPQPGGAPIEIGGTTYLFGELAGDFYNSSELTAMFPK